MPRLNGRDVRNEILKVAPGVKILFMSGYTDDVIAQQGLLEQGADLVIKPVDATTLLRAVRAALDAR
jgi:FixJ family two-component response regulator